ncbi:MAG: DUF4433 domain-containing protein [Bdellovibrionaceae bacterium]|nr:DUF4433 domain-containing protein [Pseudobdellovibrionaceae bacterium]
MTSLPLNKQIYAKYQLGPASHMTHLGNVEAIVRAGELRSYNLMRDHSYQNLANEDVQAGRAAKVVPPTGRPLHDYVPLYFGNRTPMVAVNQQHNQELVFIRFSLDLLTHGNLVITDGNARSASTVFRVFTQLTDLDILDPKAINTPKYKGNPELKRRKQAEILVPERLSLQHAYDFIAYSETAHHRLLEIFDRCGTRFNVLVRPGNWYFRTPNQGTP